MQKTDPLKTDPHILEADNFRTSKKRLSLTNTESVVMKEFQLICLKTVSITVLSINAKSFADF